MNQAAVRTLGRQSVAAATVPCRVDSPDDPGQSRKNGHREAGHVPAEHQHQQGWRRSVQNVEVQRFRTIQNGSGADASGQQNGRGGRPAHPDDTTDVAGTDVHVVDESPNDRKTHLVLTVGVLIDTTRSTGCVR